ncbi:MAG: M56 family metallopeptidase [Actinomycetota bacterium]|nr:M56 family metallopeptidase [Actinomycetota bacterium]
MTFLLMCLIAAAVIAWSVLGPRALRRAAPYLARMPRAASLGHLGLIASWAAAALAIGPMFAWVLTGPQVLSPDTTEVCQRCLATASPIAGVSVRTGLPTVALLVTPLLVAVVGLGMSAVHASRAWRRSRSDGSDLRTRTTRHRIAGRRVRVLEQDDPTVFALPRAHGGVIISEGALRLLDDDEVRAVLAHEDAHVRQRHHLIMLIATTISAPVRWVPLIDSAMSAIRQYLEIAADNAARRAVSTTALAGALLKLEPQHPTVSNRGAALHAGGPNRVQQLVAGPDAPRNGAVAAAGVVAYLVLSATVTAAIYASYLLAANACLPGSAGF